MFKQTGERKMDRKEQIREIRMQEYGGERVSPMLFGANIEHTRSCVYQGLSAQMLRNRKFAGKPEACSGHAAQWYPIGEKALFLFDRAYTRHHELYHMKRNHECNAQRIVNASEGSLCGLGQHELVLQADHTYLFRMVAKASAPVRVTAALTARHGRTTYASCEMLLDSEDWTTCEGRLCCAVSDDDADLRLTFTARTSLCIGALSLLPEDTFHGMRSDVVACLREMGIRLLRWPGGNFAGEYNWLDGLLPADERAPLESCLGIETQPHSMGYDFHEINTDDFIALCREIGAEPFITINPCWNTAEENAAWVEYCNDDASTPYGRLRAERGHPQPYQVRLWSLGNEFGYGHMEGENTPEGYARIARENAQKMLAVSPDLRLCSSGPYPNAKWADECAAKLKDSASLVSEHFYAHVPEYPDAAHFGQEYNLVVNDVETLRSQIRQNRADLPMEVEISMDEWNVWYAWYRPSSVMDGVFAARTLHMLMSEAKDCRIAQACHFEAVNEGLLCAPVQGAYLTAQGQVFRVMKDHIGGQICMKGLDAFATRRDGVITLTAVNPSFDRAERLHVRHEGEVLSAVLYHSDGVIPPSFFTQEEACVELEEQGSAIELPPHSLLALKLKA